MTIGTILLILLVLLLIGAFPSWSHSRSWGYGPSYWVGGGDLGRSVAGQDIALWQSCNSIRRGGEAVTVRSGSATFPPMRCNAR